MANMNPWLVIFLIALALVAVIMAFYAILSYIVIAVARKHGEEMFKKYTQQLEAALPGKDCGKCGCATCHMYAERLVRGEEEDATLCTEIDEEALDKLKSCIFELELLLAPSEKLESPDTRDNGLV